MKILIGADLVPTESNKEIFSSGNVKEIIGDELYSILSKADIRIFNLEVPLTDRINPIYKCGPNLIASTSTIRGIKAINPNLLTLANNHILDQGELGLKSTISILKENNISYVGAGNNIEEAAKPYVINMNDTKIGVYACAEHEFTIATDNCPGANPFDPLESLDHISNLKNKCDYVIVLYHGGKEHYRYPSPYLQKVCRKIVDKGADVVICQHSHCIGSIENYKNSKIIYGQGNFIFDDEDSNEYWDNSILVQITLDDAINIDYIPICKVGNGIRLASKNEAVDILNKLNERSKNIVNNRFIEEQYINFANINMRNYFNCFAGYGKITRKIDRILNGRLSKLRYNRSRKIQLRNYLECEAHRELILTALKNDR